MAIRRREFLGIVAGGAAAGALGCAGEPDPDEPDGDPDPRADGAPPGSPDAEPPPPPADAGTGCDAGTVVMYDTHAQALYMDGTLGPLTGIIYVDYVLDGVEITLDFWHGHGGHIHQFTLEPEHFEMLKRGERVTLRTTEVDSHSHELFIDPTDPSYRVDGAEPVEVPLGC